MLVQDYYIVSMGEVYIRKDIRIDGVHTSLESIVKSSLASAAGKDLGLDDQFVRTCKRTTFRSPFSRESEITRTYQSSVQL